MFGRGDGVGWTCRFGIVRRFRVHWFSRLRRPFEGERQFLRCVRGYIARGDLDWRLQQVKSGYLLPRRRLGVGRGISTEDRGLWGGYWADTRQWPNVARLSVRGGRVATPIQYGNSGADKAGEPAKIRQT
jgi:hypothetical protein